MFAVGRLTTRVLWKAAPLLIMVGGVVLLYSGVNKVVENARFAQTLGEHGLLGLPAIELLRVCVPLTEILVGMVAIHAAIFPRARASGCVVLSIAFTVLAVYAAVLVMQPPPAATGCGCALRYGLVQSWWRIAAENSGIALGYLVLGIVVPGPSALSAEKHRSEPTGRSAGTSDPMTAGSP